MLVRPCFKRHLRVEVLPGEGVVVLSETERFVFPEPLCAAVASRLDGTRTVDAIVAALDEVAPAHAVRAVVADLERRGLVTEAGRAGVSAHAPFWASCGVDPALAEQRLAADAVAVEVAGDVDPRPLRDALRAVGVTVQPDAARRLVLTDDYLRSEIRNLNRVALDEQRHWFLARPVGAVVWIGPLFRPGLGACWQCLATRLCANRDVESFLAQRNGGATPLAPPLTSSPAGEEIAARITALTVAAWLARGSAPDFEDNVVTVDLRSWRSEVHRVVARPQCPACGDPPEPAGESARPIVLASRRKTFTVDGGHRTRTPEATVERYQHHVSPITGAVAALERSGPQREGVLHAYFAGPNFSRPPQTLAMLREGLRVRTGGKGASDAQARASALCEALERSSGVFQGDEPRRQARFRDLADRAIHPNACMGFSERQYGERETWNARGDMTQVVPLPFDEDARISWTPVWSLSRAETRYLPTAFCFYDYPVFPEGAFCIACSNGNAAGNTFEEAILSGFLELVERDSVALWWYSRARRPGVAIDGFDEPYVARVRAYLHERGRDLEVLDLTSDLAIPVFAAVSRRRDVLPERIVLGFGAHLDARIALMRAVTELNQMLMRLLAAETGGGRALLGGEPSARAWLDNATLGSHPYLVPDPAVAARRASDFGRCCSDDLRDDIGHCQRLIEARGMEMLVLDQTRPDIGLPVAKVVVPGLRHFWPRFAPGRLYEIPVEIGWIPRRLSESELNPVAMFL